jgi:predicted RNA-binding protein with PIN domain
MSLHIIIDGYNFIYQSNRLSAFVHRNFQQGREALIKTLLAYKRNKPHKISVVFDGSNAPHFSTHKDYNKGIEIKFSQRGETADTVIKRIAAREKEKVLIVSSDREIINFAASQGAATISSSLFEEKIAFPVPWDDNAGGFEDASSWTPTTKKKGPRRRLSKRERHNRVKTRKL